MPDEIRRLAPDIPWPLIACFRDLVAHAYFRVDVDEVWDIVSNEVPELLRQIRELRSKLDSGVSEA